MSKGELRFFSSVPKGELKVGDLISINFSLKKISSISVAT